MEASSFSSQFAVRSNSKPLVGNYISTDNISDDLMITNDAPPTFYETVPTLQEMSCNAIAIAIWQPIFSMDSCRYMDLFEANGIIEAKKSLEKLPLPNLIKDIVRNRIDYVKDEVISWLRYYQENLFFIGTSSARQCHWLPDGKIDYRKSAINMLPKFKTFNERKLHFACMFCLKEEIMKWPPDLIPPFCDISSDSGLWYVDAERNGIVYYWLCHLLKGNVDKLPEVDGESFECFLITSFSVNTWSAIEYFWNRLNADEQLLKAEVLILRKPQFQKQLFSKMNDFQKTRLLHKLPVEILTNFWQQAQYQCALQTWLYVRHFVNYQQFQELIGEFLRKYSSESDNTNTSGYVVEIWNRTPSNLKNEALEHSMIDEIFSLLLLNSYDSHSGDIDFLSAFLSHYSLEYRKEILLERVDDLLTIFEVHDIDKLLKRCSTNTKQVDEFKRCFLDSESALHHCHQMMDEVRLNELNRFLEYFCFDSNVRSEFCCKIFDVFVVGGVSCSDLRKWIEVIEFIDNNLLHTPPHTALQWKKKVIWSFATVCCKQLLDADEMEKMFDIVDKHLDVEEVQAFKKEVLSTIQDDYHWFEFDERIVNRFLLWCFDDDTGKVKSFIKSLPIDDIVVDICNDIDIKWRERIEVDFWYLTNVIFKPMNDLLLWFFEDVDCVKRYKLRTVVDYFLYARQNWDDEDNHNYEYFENYVISWLCDGDVEEISKLKEELFC